MLKNLKILWHQGKQYIPDVTTAQVPGIFKGRPVISMEVIDEKALATLCPSQAIGTNPISIDLGKCIFCGECALQYPNKIRFTTDYHLATNQRHDLIVKAGVDTPITVNPKLVRADIHNLFGGSLKLRQVSAGGDASCELELNACGNVQFDMGRFGIDFVASPRHADGIVITGSITENMAEPLERCYNAIPNPKIIILAGTDAISGSLTGHSQAINRSFLDKYQIDLYIAGNPIHPLTFINGVLGLIKKNGVR